MGGVHTINSLCLLPTIDEHYRLFQFLIIKTYALTCMSIIHIFWCTCVHICISYTTKSEIAVSKNIHSFNFSKYLQFEPFLLSVFPYTALNYCLHMSFAYIPQVLNFVFLLSISSKYFLTKKGMRFWYMPLKSSITYYPKVCHLSILITYFEL